MVWCECISGEGRLAGRESCHDTRHLPPAQLIVKFNCSGRVSTSRGNICNAICRIQILCIKMSRVGPESVNNTKLKKLKKGVCVVFFFVCFVADHYSPSSPRDLTTCSLSFNSGLKVTSALDGVCTTAFERNHTYLFIYLFFQCGKLYDSWKNWLCP